MAKEEEKNSKKEDSVKKDDDSKKKEDNKSNGNELKSKKGEVKELKEGDKPDKENKKKIENKKEDKKIDEKEDEGIGKAFAKTERTVKKEPEIKQKINEGKLDSVNYFFESLGRWFLTLIIIAIILVGIYFVFILTNDVVSENFENIRMRYVAVQCYGNPWEIDWFKNNAGQYPINQEREIFENYYLSKGVEIKDFYTVENEDEVCTACDCPRGEDIVVLISVKDKPKMVELGFVEN
jgi:hypothetical protein